MHTNDNPQLDTESALYGEAIGTARRLAVAVAAGSRLTNASELDAVAQALRIAAHNGPLSERMRRDIATTVRTVYACAESQTLADMAARIPDAIEAHWYACERWVNAGKTLVPSPAG